MCCARRCRMRCRGLALQHKLDAFFCKRQSTYAVYVRKKTCPTLCPRVWCYAWAFSCKCQSTYALYSRRKTCPNLCPRVWCYAWYDSSDAGFLCPTLCPSSLYWDCHIKHQMDTKSASGHYNTINRGGKCPGLPVVRSSIVVLDLSRGGSCLLFCVHAAAAAVDAVAVVTSALT